MLVLIVIVFLCLIDVFKVFEVIFVMIEGGSGLLIEIVVLWIF